MSELVAAFANLTRQERQAISVAAAERRDALAGDNAKRWNEAWAEVWALVAASAAEATAVEDRALYEMSKQVTRSGWTFRSFGPDDAS